MDSCIPHIKHAVAAATNAARDRPTIALRLTKHLAPSPAAAAENVVFSPLSLYAALALVAAGVRGATLAQLLAFLGTLSAKELADFGRGVADRFLADRSDSAGPCMLFGGGIWVDASRGRLTDAFRDVATKSYQCEARLVNFVEEMYMALDGMLTISTFGTNFSTCSSKGRDACLEQIFEQFRLVRIPYFAIEKNYIPYLPLLASKVSLPYK